MSKSKERHKWMIGPPHKCVKCGLLWRDKSTGKGREISESGGRSWYTEPRMIPPCIPGAERS